MEDRNNWSPQPRLCEACWTIFIDGALEPGKWKTHHTSRISIEKAIAMSCEICRQITFLRDEKIYRSTYIIREKLSADLPWRELNICREGYFASYEGDFNIFDVESLRSEFQLAEKSLARSYTGHEDVLNLARHWFLDCVNNHGPACSRRERAPWYPTRLLDVSREPVKLIMSDTSAMDKPYATVSYCWGTKPFLRLTSSTMTRFQTGVAIEEFPQVFQDVIKTARHLEIQLLWVDCYCIIQSEGSSSHHHQHSTADWERECRNMDNVYESSILNFGVTHTESPLESCFQQRQAQLWKPLLVDWRPAAGDAKSCYQIIHEKEPQSKTSALVKNKPLFSRGWVLQERLLCPRMLYFDQSQIYWECSGTPAQIFDHMFKSETLPALVGRGSSSWYTLRCHPWSIDAAMQLTNEKQWMAIANSYSPLSLTYPDKDKFSALSGIAKRAASWYVGDEYIAGMFRRSLVRHLAWVVQLKPRVPMRDGAPSRDSNRSISWRAPTWSWLSIDGSAQCVLGRAGNMIELAELVDVEVQLSDPQNPFGSIISASIELRCRLMDCPVTDYRVKKSSIGQDEAVYHWDDKFKRKKTHGNVKIAFILAELEELGSMMNCTNAISRDDVPTLQGIISSVPSWNDKIYWTGLIVEAMDNNAYQRLGLMSIIEHHPSGPSHVLDHLFRLDEKTLTLI